MAGRIGLKTHRSNSYTLKPAPSETIELNSQQPTTSISSNHGNKPSTSHSSNQQPTTPQTISSGSSHDKKASTSSQPNSQPMTTQQMTSNGGNHGHKPHTSSQHGSPQKKCDKYGRGYRVVYLGSVPTYQSGGPDPTSHLVEKLLDACNVQEARMKDVFIDIKSYGLLMYYVDEDCKIYNSKLYDLARISYCQVHENGGFGQGSIVSWIYRQETDTGFQLQCHAVQCKTGRKAHNICSRLFKACHTLYQEVQMAMRTSRLFAEASKRLAPREQEVPDGAQYWNEAFQHLDEDEDGSVLEGQVGQLQLQHSAPLLLQCHSSSSSMTSSSHHSAVDYCPSSPSLCSVSSHQEMCFMAEVHAPDEGDHDVSSLIPATGDIVEETSDQSTDREASESISSGRVPLSDLNQLESPLDSDLTSSHSQGTCTPMTITDFKMSFLEPRDSDMDTYQSLASSSASLTVLTPGIPASNLGLGDERVMDSSYKQQNIFDTHADSGSCHTTPSFLDSNHNVVGGESDSSLEECVASDSDMDTGVDNAHRVDV